MPSFSNESFDINAFSELAFDIGTPTPNLIGIDSEAFDVEEIQCISIDSEDI